MADTAAETPSVTLVPVATPKKAKTPKAKAEGAKKVAKPKGEKKVPSHPSAAIMVLEAVTNLNEKNGSSLQAIKKYIADHNKVDVEKQALFIRKALKNAVEKGTLTQTKGQGASGSFKLPVKPKPAKRAPVAGEKKVKVAKKEKAGTPKAKKAAAKKTGVKAAAPKAKKPAAGTPKVKAAKAKAPKAKAAKPAGDKKAKKAATKPKSPKTKVPKTLKPKAAAKPKSSPKKAAPKKK